MYSKLLLYFSSVSLVFTASAQKADLVKPVFPEVFSQFQNVRDFSKNQDGTVFYFTALSHLEELSILVQSTKTGDSWKTQQLITPSGKYKDLEPFLSPDGLKLYFASNRPNLGASEAKEDFDIWYLERANLNEQWSDPINIGSPINSEFNEFYPSVSSNGNLYFTSDRPESKGKDDIYKSEWKSNSYLIPVPLSDSINTDGYEFNAFISPNEDFIIFSGYNREDGFGSGDLYISTKLNNGDWTLSKNMGESINSDKMDYCPFIDFKTNSIYFTSKRSEIAPKELGSLEEFMAVQNTYKNGQSKIYKAPFKLN